MASGSKIADFRFYNTILTPTQISTIYATTTNISLNPKINQDLIVYNCTLLNNFSISKNINAATINLSPVINFGIINENLKAWYKFNDYLDSSGNNYNLVSTSTTLSNGIVTFNGSTSYLSGTIATLPSGFSVSFWAYRTAAISGTGFVFFILGATGTANQSCQVYCNASGNYCIDYWEGGGLLSSSVYTTDINTWIHFVMVINGTTTRTLYRNGVSIATGTPTGTLSMNTSISIGKGNGGQLYFTGSIDDLRFYNSVLTAAQVSELYTGRVNFNYTNGGSGGGGVLTNLGTQNSYLYPPIYLPSAATGSGNATLVLTSGTLQTSVISNQSYGNGTYTITSSTTYTTAGLLYPSFLFTNNTSSSGIFYGENSGALYSTTGYTGSVSTTVISNSISQIIFGEWVQIQLPKVITITSYSLFPRNKTAYPNQNPKEFYVVGSTDGSTWNQLDHQILTSNYSDLISFSVFNITTVYNYFRLIFIKTFGDSQNLTLQGWYLYGIELYPYPPIALPSVTTASGTATLTFVSNTNNTSTITGQTYGNGLYTMTSSSTYPTPLYPAFIFTNNTSTGTTNIVWVDNSGAYSSTGYTGSTSTTINGIAQKGEWVQIKLPSSIILTSYGIMGHRRL